MTRESARYWLPVIFALLVMVAAGWIIVNHTP